MISKQLKYADASTNTWDRPFNGSKPKNIKVRAEDWRSNRHAFSGSDSGQNASVETQIADDALQIEALVPWWAAIFDPAIEGLDGTMRDGCSLTKARPDF